MKDKKKTDIIIYIVTIVLSVLFIVLGNKIVTGKDSLVGYEDDGTEILKVVVTKVSPTEENADSWNGYTEKVTFFEGQVISGAKKGQTVVAVQQNDDYFNPDAETVKLKDKVILNSNSYIDGADYIMTDYARSDYMIFLMALFCVSLVIFGRFKGFSTLISLAFTVASVIFIFIPGILHGANIYVTAFAVCVYMIVMTLVIVSGINKKCLCAIIGCTFGTMTIAAIYFISDAIINLTGYLNDTSIYIHMLNNENPIDLKAIIFGSILVGAVGAVMDVAMSLSSSLYELYNEIENPTFGVLMRSGMNIGRDMMGTMSNTLILAYIGNSLPVLLMMIATVSSSMDFFNRELIVVEMLKSLSGSLGILLTIPLTSFVCSAIYCGNRRKKNDPAEEPESFSGDPFSEENVKKFM